ncbi:MAG TPA: YncE family protein [Bacteroidia bacterium]
MHHFFRRKKILYHIAIYLGIACICISSLTCKKSEPDSNYQGYPPEVGKIILNKCATPGCHTDKSRDAANGLSLESWNSLFTGSRYGNSAVIPYHPELSFLSYFINTYSDLGPSNSPTMPTNSSALSRDEVTTIRNWIGKGAQARNGMIPFSPLAEHMQLFVINQGCDNVYDVDAMSGLIMRSYDIGTNPTAIEQGHEIDITHDNKYFCVCFLNGSVFQKFRVSDGSLVGSANIGNGSWSTFVITPNDSLAFIADWEANGRIAIVDLTTMTLKMMYQGSSLLQYPHGVGFKNNWLYVTALPGNFFYKINVTDINNPVFYQIPMQPGEAPSTNPKYNGHAIHFSDDGSEFDISCELSNEVRFFKTANDSLIATVPVGKKPQHPHYSGTMPYVFVTCMDDDVTFPGKIGSVYVINTQSHTVVKSIFTGWQPHGIMIDDADSKVFVLNRNVTPSGPAPHHSSACGGRNGYMTAIDMTKLTLVPYFKPELGNDPYFMGMLGHHH